MCCSGLLRALRSRPPPGVLLRFFVVVLGLAVGLATAGPRVAIAAPMSLEAGVTVDNLSLWSAEAKAAAVLPGPRGSHFTPALRGYAFGADTIQGVPGGWRASGALALAWSRSRGPLGLGALLGFDDVLRYDSLRAGAKIDWVPSTAHGLGARAEVRSGWRTGWLTYSVRSTTAAAALTFASRRDWAELGGVLDDRRGGRRPATPLPVTLPPNLLGSAYLWWLHACTAWLSLGSSLRHADSLRDFHQPTAIVGGAPVYTDYPYPTPQDESSVGGVLALQLGPVSAKASWPVYATGRYRFEDPVLGQPPRFYRGEHMTLAELSLGVTVPFGSDVELAVEGQLMSRPYVPAAWLTRDAWNQLGLTLKLARSPSDEEEERP